MIDAPVFSRPVKYPAPVLFAGAMQRLQQRFGVYVGTCPSPLPSRGLQVTPEIRYQSELYLPLEEIRRLFYRYYRASLRHRPILASTPFHAALSWADCLACLPPWLQADASPVRLLDRLLCDPELHERFIFASFMPIRFNGAGFGRYPGQLSWLQCWLAAEQRQGREQLNCLDAACGSGEGSWELLELAAQGGWKPQQLLLDGWTLDPLEVYAASNRYLPHAPQRQAVYRQRIGPLITHGWGEVVRFQAADLLADRLPAGHFELILCNGLLGGPILHTDAELQRVVAALAGRLRPGGRLLAANQFHGGWQRIVAATDLVALFKQAGLVVEAAGEGIVGRRMKGCAAAA